MGSQHLSPRRRQRCLIRPPRVYSAPFTGHSARSSVSRHAPGPEALCEVASVAFLSSRTIFPAPAMPVVVLTFLLRPTFLVVLPQSCWSGHCSNVILRTGLSRPSVTWPGFDSLLRLKVRVPPSARKQLTQGSGHCHLGPCHRAAHGISTPLLLAG